MNSQLLNTEFASMAEGREMHQTFLNDIKDHWGFLDFEGNWQNHRACLLLALHLTEGDVIECGSGDGSTFHLRLFCYQNKRNFFSYDSNLQWAQRTNSKFIEDWEKADIWKPCGLCFIDHAPGEDRHLAVKRMMDKADIIVCHDSEIGGAGDYKFETVFPLFKYQLHFNRTQGGAGASMLSNKIDVSKFKGLQLGKYKFDL